MPIALVSSHFLNNNIDQYPPSFCSLTALQPYSLTVLQPYNWSIASSKASSPQSAIYCFLFQFQISSSFSYSHPITAYFFFLVFPSLLSFPLSFIQYRVLQVSSYTTYDQCSLPFLLFTVCRTFLSSLTLCNTTSFLIRSVQVIFLNLLQHHISNLSRYF